MNVLLNKKISINILSYNKESLNMKDYCENKTLNKYESKIKKASLKLLDCYEAKNNI